MTDPFRLDGKVALVTGGTRGIGRAIAAAFLVAGATVVIASEDGDDTRVAAHDLGCTGIACDVTDEAALDALVAGTLAAHGALDIVVANAGITGIPGSWSGEDFDRVMAINLRSQVRLLDKALPHMAVREGASAVLVASIAGLRGNAAINAYALAKAGVAQLARNLAVQWGPKGVRVNAMSPGFIATPLSAPLLADAAFMARRMQMTPLRRAGTPEDIANAALFLASPAAAFVTGHTLVVDGGTTITDGS
ncbi:SDR family NAD(P)-dependent oxidoreductase [Sphingomonas sp. SUN039]|uniref:SDR family NAD(P)-dependent oxidoreductase n=1 Tax=Sphingomonas sp. SUN039 TaxID=2937787 RepID=UPI002164EED0|nr:SDR family oxidoreductase [Sphingomonas sp. SUN039]UVO54359.1 SDR family oxidoreductase [Sphingomonas sp. SUN039]